MNIDNEFINLKFDQNNNDNLQKARWQAFAALLAKEMSPADSQNAQRGVQDAQVELRRIYSTAGLVGYYEAESDMAVLGRCARRIVEGLDRTAPRSY